MKRFDYLLSKHEALVAVGNLANWIDKAELAYPQVMTPATRAALGVLEETGADETRRETVGALRLVLRGVVGRWDKGRGTAEVPESHAERALWVLSRQEEYSMAAAYHLMHAADLAWKSIDTHDVHKIVLLAVASVVAVGMVDELQADGVLDRFVGQNMRDIVRDLSVTDPAVRWARIRIEGAGKVPSPEVRA